MKPNKIDQIRYVISFFWLVKKLRGSFQNFHEIDQTELKFNIDLVILIFLKHVSSPGQVVVSANLDL